MSQLGSFQLALLMEEGIVHAGEGGKGRAGSGVVGCAKPVG